MSDLSAAALLAAPKPLDAAEVLQRMQSAREQGLGVWFNDVPFDEGLELLREFTSQNLFFDDYNHHDLVELLCAMDVLEYNAKAPITKQGERSTWVGVLLRGTVDVYVKGTKVAKIPAGAMIGDTGTIEGGSRSADCEGSEGGGVIALLRFDKMDALHATQPRLAYKLAMSFGGVVVRKLRQAMGKVFKKDNKARAGADIGRRRLLIPETKPGSHKYRLPGDPTTDDEIDDEEHQPQEEEQDRAQKDEQKQDSSSSGGAQRRWGMLKNVVRASGTFAKAATEQLKEPRDLSEEEVLYLARAKRIRDPMSEEAEKKLRLECVRLRKEKEAGAAEIERLTSELKNARAADANLVQTAAIQGRALRRYERFWIADHAALSAIRGTHDKVVSELQDVTERAERAEVLHETTVRDMEDELEFVRGREIFLEKRVKEAEAEAKMLRVRIQSLRAKEETATASAARAQKGNHSTLQRITRALEGQQRQLHLANQATATARSEQKEAARVARVRLRWQNAVARACARRLRAVRVVAKLHRAWWEQITAHTKRTQAQTARNIETWRVKVGDAEQERRAAQRTAAQTAAKLRAANGRAAALTTGCWALLRRLCLTAHDLRASRDDAARGAEERRRLEMEILKRDARLKDTFGRMRAGDEKAANAEAEHARVWQALRRATKDLEKREDSVRRLKEQTAKLEANSERDLARVHAYLLQSDAENHRLSRSTTELQRALGEVVRRVFSSECRRVELEQQFGKLARPSPQLRGLLQDAGFIVDVALPVHEPESSEDDRARMRRRERERGWNSPVAGGRSRPRTAPADWGVGGGEGHDGGNGCRNGGGGLEGTSPLPALPGTPKQNRNGADQHGSAAGGGSGGPVTIVDDSHALGDRHLVTVEGEPDPALPGTWPRAVTTPKRTPPPPYYPDPAATRRGMPDFDEGVSRTLSYWDNSRHHYIKGLSGNTAEAGRKKFWGSANKKKKSRHGQSPAASTRHGRPSTVGGGGNRQRGRMGMSGGRPSTSAAVLGRANRGGERGTANRWYHAKFAARFDDASSGSLPVRGSRGGSGGGHMDASGGGSSGYLSPMGGMESAGRSGGSALFDNDGQVGVDLSINPAGAPDGRLSRFALTSPVSAGRDWPASHGSGKSRRRRGAPRSGGKRAQTAPVSADTSMLSGWEELQEDDGVTGKE